MRTPSPKTSRERLATLISGIGGPQNLILILTRFYQALSIDPMVGFFFTGKDLEHIAKKQSEFMLMAAGVREGFQGKGPATAHSALPPILTGHFDRRLIILKDTLSREGLTPIQIETWVEFEESFRAVVTAP